MLRPEVIRKRLNKLEEYLTILEGMQKYALDEFLTEPERYGSAERFMQLAIEALTDMGSYVIAERKLGVVNWSSDIPAIFLQQGLIDRKLKDRWIQAIGFRNVLVHEYLDIDRVLVHQVLQEHVQDLREIGKVFATFL